MPGFERSQSITNDLNWPNRDSLLLDILNGKERNPVADEGGRSGVDEQHCQPMEVLLDTCWAIMVEVEQMEQPSIAFQQFRARCKLCGSSEDRLTEFSFVFWQIKSYLGKFPRLAMPMTSTT